MSNIENEFVNIAIKEQSYETNSIYSILLKYKTLVMHLPIKTSHLNVNYANWIY